jgi:mersacidin/lichenicidin family type 2 lantibiotic
MSTLQIVRAWKDETYRRSLTQQQLADLPAHPAGEIEFERGPVAAKTNGNKCQSPTTAVCTAFCTPYTVWKGSGSTCA